MDNIQATTKVNHSGKDSTTEASKRKNYVSSNLDDNIIESIRQSLSRPIGVYKKNLRGVSEFDWHWQGGSTTTFIKYKDGYTETRENSDPPPTRACHDVAHFIAALNGSLEWDYMQDINHLCEFNAVSIECLLTYCAHSAKTGFVPDLELQAKAFVDHMKWFSEDYYRIPERHPSSKKFTELISDFTSSAKPDLLSKYFGIFYEVWEIENIVGTQNFNVSVNMTDSIDSKYPMIATTLSSQIDSINHLIANLTTS